MTADFSYQGGPVDANDSLGLVRLMLGDTNSADPMLTDSEINVVLSIQSTPSYAAAACAELIAARFSRYADIEIGETAVKHAQKARAFERLAERLRKGGPGLIPGGDGSATKIPQVFAGGSSKSDIESFYSAEDNVKPSFAIGQDDLWPLFDKDPVDGK